MSKPHWGKQQYTVYTCAVCGKQLLMDDQREPFDEGWVQTWTVTQAEQWVCKECYRSDRWPEDADA